MQQGAAPQPRDLVAKDVTEVGREHAVKDRKALGKRDKPSDPRRRRLDVR